MLVKAARSTHAQVARQQRAEDANHRVVAERRDADDEEVTQKARRDDVSTAARWRHRTQEVRVLKHDLRRVLQIVPTQPPPTSDVTHRQTSAGTTNRLQSIDAARKRLGHLTVLSLNCYVNEFK